MKLAMVGLIGGMVFGLMVSGLANASSYRHERHEYRNVYPRSRVFTYDNGYRGSSRHRYERRIIVPFNSHSTRHTTRPYYKSHGKHERYGRVHHGR